VLSDGIAGTGAARRPGRGFHLSPHRRRAGGQRAAHHGADRPRGTGAPARPARAEVRQDRAAADPAAPAGASGSLAWFWERVPRERGASGGRFQLAIRTLDDGPNGRAVPRPRMQPLQRMAEAHGKRHPARDVGTAVSPALALAVIAVESSGRADAVSHAGAQGLMQLIPATAQRFGVTDAFDTTQNIAGGVAYLDWLMRQFDRDVVLALAGYNAGEGAVQRAGGVPNYAETRDYVPKVLAAWTVARGLCTEPPQLPSDPCIFRIGQLRAAQASPRPRAAEGANPLPSRGVAD
jgi:soluble lytic murein transglycosylase-like protein